MAKEMNHQMYGAGVNTGKNTIFGFQILRGICCLGILLAHSCHYAETYFSSIEPGFLSFPGRVGMLNYVTFFFVLSGYLTAGQIHQGGSAVHHVKSRFWGIYPLYWMSLSVVILIMLCVHNEVRVSDGFWKSLLLLHGDHTFLCNVEWTLQFEIVFYVLVAPFFYYKLQKAYPLFVLCFITFILFCKLEVITFSSDLLRFIITGRDALLNIFMGSAMYYLSLAISKKKWWLWMFDCLEQRIIIVLAACAMLMATIYIDSSIVKIDTFAEYILAYLLFFAIIQLFACIRVMPSNFLVCIGNNSYVIYLVHPTLLCSVFLIMNYIGIKYGYLVHIITVLTAVTLLIGLSEILRSAVKGMKNKTGSFFVKR